MLHFVLLRRLALDALGRQSEAREPACGGAGPLWAVCTAWLIYYFTLGARATPFARREKMVKKAVTYLES